MPSLRWVVAVVLAASTASALEPVAAGAKVFIDQNDGFGHYLAAAFRVKGVPLIVVANRAIADYEIQGHAESQKAGWAKIVFKRQLGSREETSMSVIDLRTSEVVFAYNYNMDNTYRGKQSAAESCAKHLAAEIHRNGRLASSLPPLTPDQIESRKQEEISRRGPPPVQQRLPAQTVSPVAAFQTPQPVVVIERKAEVSLASEPSGAEVLVDGVYWGITPVNVPQVGLGQHVVLVKKRGYSAWERRIVVVPGSQAIHANLEAEPTQSEVVKPQPDPTKVSDGKTRVITLK